MKNVKSKDIIILVVATVVIVVAAYAIWTLLNPKKGSDIDSATVKKAKVTGQIDETTYKRIETLSDYGKPALENIGKSNLFE